MVRYYYLNRQVVPVFYIFFTNSTMENLEEENNEVTPDVEETEENSQEQDDAEEESVVFEKKRYNEILSWKQAQLDNTRKLALETAVELAKADGSSLIRLYQKDPKLANEVAQDLNYDDYNDALQEIKRMSWDSLSKKKDDEDEDFDTKYTKRRNQERHQDAIKKAEKAMSKLDDEEQEAANKYFEKITKWQQLDTESVDDFIEMVTLFVKKDKNKADKLDEAKKSFWSTNVSKSAKSGADSEWPYIAKGRLYTS